MSLIGVLYQIPYQVFHHILDILYQAMRRARRLAPRHVDDDVLVNKEVEHLLEQTSVPTSQRDQIFHMEHVILIRLAEFCLNPIFIFIITRLTRFCFCHHHRRLT